MFNPLLPGVCQASETEFNFASGLKKSYMLESKCQLGKYLWHRYTRQQNVEKSCIAASKVKINCWLVLYNLDESVIPSRFQGKV